MRFLAASGEDRRNIRWDLSHCVGVLDPFGDLNVSDRFDGFHSADREQQFHRGRGGGLPDLTLPPDVKLQFNPPKTGNSVKDAALQGLVQEEEAQYKAIVTGVTSGPLVDDFVIQSNSSGSAENSIKSLLIYAQGKAESVTGTNVYYNWKFPNVDPNGKDLQVTFCTDENKFFSKNRATGQIIPQSGLDQIYSYTVNMVVDVHDGRWKPALYTWKQGDVTCQAAEGH